MSVTVTYTFDCGGCDAEVVGKSQIVTRAFRSWSGRGHGLGNYYIEHPEIEAPEGWVAFDPYTGCCYCPDCWAGIISGPAEESA